MFLCFRLILGSSPFGKEVSHEPPLPCGISNDFPWGLGGGGMDIFWNHTIKMDDGSG